MEMEIRAWLFFWFCSIISISFLVLAFLVLDKTDLSNSFSPIIMFIFKHSLAILACHSSDYALIFRPQMNNIPNDRYYMLSTLAVYPLLFNISGGLAMSDFMPTYVLMNFLVVVVKINLTTAEKIGITVLFLAQSSLFLVGASGGTEFYTSWVLLIADFTAASRAMISGGVRFRVLLPLAAAMEHHEIFPSSIFKNKKGKLIEFGLGLVGTILFQNFFKLTSYNHVLAFLYLSVSWLAILALIRASTDLGVLNFLLSNVIVSCTVSQFGLRLATWLAYGVSLLLFSLRLMLESLTLVHKAGGAQVIVWK